MPEARDPRSSPRAPSVPAGGSCLRLTARAGPGEGDFGTAARALAAVRDHVRTASPAGRKPQ